MGKLANEPVRFNCRDEGLQLLSDPKVVEDIEFANIVQLEQQKRDNGRQKEITFAIDGDRIELNKLELYTEFNQRGRLPKKEAATLADATSKSFTGIAFWPRLILDNNNSKSTDDIIVNSRSYPNGNHQKSHWQTVLPIMTGNTPIMDLKDGDKVMAKLDFEAPTAVTKTPTYHV